MAQHLTAPVATKDMPKGIPYIIGNEAAERFSYYGMLAILQVFMTEHLMTADGQADYMTDPETRVAMSLFKSAAYAFPFLGALLADAFLGKYRTILYLSSVYVLGHFCLALMDMPETALMATMAPRNWMYLGLFLIAVGAGGIKPCVSAHVGDQFGESNKHLLERVFSGFYFSINLGAAISMWMIPIMLHRFGPGVAFGIPGVLMAIATFAFWMGRHEFVHIPAKGTEFIKEVFSKEGFGVLLKLLPIYAFVAVFWSVYDQSGSTWVEQAKEMDRVFLGFEWLPSQVQAINGLFILAYIPLFAFVVYPMINKVFPLTPVRKIGLGLFLTVFAFGISAVCQEWIDAGQTPSIAWQILAYVVLTAGEVMVSITCLEFSYTQAPTKMKSLVMATYLGSVSAGNLITAGVNLVTMDAEGNSTFTGADYYWFFVGLMAVAAVLYIGVAYIYKPKEYLQQEAVAA
ncbi:MAG: POT family MFS transporter [Proteobacteria bacterium]|nr:POT family MFS transporter [Pseudomonadota bacterium]